MVIKILVLAAVAVAALLIYATTKPNSFEIRRSIVIHAPAEKIYPFMADFHQWEFWSPYEKIDPTMKKKFSGASNGTGAIYEWTGEGKAGAGRMEITETTSPEKIRIKLDFLKPFEAHNLTDFLIESKNGTTTVTWLMYGPSPFMSKLMGIFINLDTMIGKDFETGLSNLKAIAEK